MINVTIFMLNLGRFCTCTITYVSTVWNIFQSNWSLIITYANSLTPVVHGFPRGGHQFLYLAVLKIGL